jgi:hypothetical protein
VLGRCVRLCFFFSFQVAYLGVCWLGTIVLSGCLSVLSDGAWLMDGIQICVDITRLFSTKADTTLGRTMGLLFRLWSGPLSTSQLQQNTDSEHT